MKQIVLIVFIICMAISLMGMRAPEEIYPLLYASGYQWTHDAKMWVFGAVSYRKWYNLPEIKMKTNGKKFNPEDYTQEQLMQGINVTIDGIREDSAYQIYSKTVLLGKQKAQKATYIVDGYANKILTFKFKSIKNKSDFVIGIGGRWNPFPRKSKVLAPKDVYSLDLEGDGEQVNIRLERGQVALKDSDEKTYYKPGVKTYLERKGEKVLIEEFPVDGIDAGEYYVLPIDLNGDGRMELLRVAEDHNTSIAAYEFEDNKFTMVLQYYVGD